MNELQQFNTFKNQVMYIWESMKHEVLTSKRPDTFFVITLTLMDLKNHKSKLTRKKTTK
jgi:hypothetical protein